MITSLRGRETRPQTVHRPGGRRHETPASDWVPTTCRMCLVGGGGLVNVNNGSGVNVIGNPDSPVNRGRICAKGKSGIMNHYNPNRVMKPLKRTNPEKGMGVDPQWRGHSGDEAVGALGAETTK